MRVLVFGNPLLRDDSLPLRLIPKLQGAFPDTEFLDLDPTEDLDRFGPDLVVLDTVLGISKVKVFEGLDSFVGVRIVSMHDFDLLYNLKLLKKLGKIDNVTIIGIPMGSTEEEALEQVKYALEEFVN